MPWSPRTALEWNRFPKFFAVSLLGFAVDTALLNALVVGAGMQSPARSVAAKAISVTTSACVSFTIHRRWTYRDRRAGFRRELARYVLVRSSSVALGLALFGGFRVAFEVLLAPHLGELASAAAASNLAQVCASMIVLCYSFALLGRFAFRESGRGGDT